MDKKGHVGMIKERGEKRKSPNCILVSALLSKAPCRGVEIVPERIVFLGPHDHYEYLASSAREVKDILVVVLVILPCICLISLK